MNRRFHLGWPNRVTLARLLLVWPFAACLLYLSDPGLAWLRWVALGIFGLMAISDALDGFLARRLNDESVLGRFLDPLADKLLITVAVLMLALVGVRRSSGDAPISELHLPGWVALAAVAKDLIVSLGFAIIYFYTGRVFLQPRLIGKSCTAVQLAMVLAVLLWPDLPVWLSFLPRVLWYTATALAVAATLDYVRLGSRQVAGAEAEQEP